MSQTDFDLVQLIEDRAVTDERFPLVLKELMKIIDNSIIAERKLFFINLIQAIVNSKKIGEGMELCYTYLEYFLRMAVCNTVAVVFVGKSWVSNSLNDYLETRGYYVDSLQSIKAANRTDAIYLIVNDEQPVRENHIQLKEFLETVYLHCREFWSINYEAADRLEQGNCYGIVTGMSYATFSVDTQFLKYKMINLAHPGQDIYYDLQLLKKYYRPEMKQIIMGLAPYSLRYDESLAKLQQKRIPAYIAELGVEHGRHNCRCDENYLQTIVHIKQLLEDYFGQDFFREIHSSWIKTISSVEEGAFEIFDGKGNYKETQDKYNKPYLHTIEENKKLIKEYMDFCQSRDLSVVIYIAPYSNFYKQEWNIEYYKETLEFLEELRMEYSFELLDLAAENWSNTYFGDTGHCNHIGAIRVSERINKLLGNSR